MKEWHETSIARPNPAAEQSVTLPCKSSRGAKATACNRKSQPTKTCVYSNEDSFERSGLAHIAGQQNHAAEGSRRRFHVRLRGAVQVCGRQGWRRPDGNDARSPQQSNAHWQCRSPGRFFLPEHQGSSGHLTVCSTTPLHTQRVPTGRSAIIVFGYAESKLGRRFFENIGWRKVPYFHHAFSHVGSPVSIRHWAAGKA